MKIPTLFIPLFFFSSICISQIQTESAQNAEFYIKHVLIGAGLEVANIKHIGMIGGLGQFDADPSLIGVKSGLILSTGHVDSIAGPNDANGYTSTGTLPEAKQSLKYITRGDKDLNKLCQGRTKDITVIEFDFVPVNNTLEFNYVFASEEYTEYAGTPYNDVFGFFLSGPGIKKKINLAVLPDGKTPISINTVNNRKNKQYFRSNKRRGGFVKKIFSSKAKRTARAALRKNLQFDGLTTVLKVHYDVIPYQKYHIKIAIGDVSDRAFDSAVFLEAGSFISTVDTSGKFYDKWEKLSVNPPNIDSILGKKIPVVETDPPVFTMDENFEITEVHFDQASYTIPDSSKKDLDTLADYLLTNKNLKCVLYGYTDNVGSKNYNQILSENRAKAVMEYLIVMGIDPSRMSYVGFNFENSRNDNSTENDKAENRRVEIVLEE